MKRLFSGQIKMIRSLQNKRGRNETGLFVTEGIKAVSVLMGSGINIESVVFDRSFDPVLKERLCDQMKTAEMYEHDIESVSSLTTSEGVMAIARIPEQKPLKKYFSTNNNMLGLFSVSDPGNLGSLIRTAKWFRLDGIILYGDCADIYSPKVIRSSMGSIFLIDTIKFLKYSDSKEYIKEYRKISTYVHKRNDYKKSEIDKKILFLGNEARGIDIALEKEFDSNYRIEPEGSFESLNVSVAGGIIIHDIFRYGG
ncbi:MAG TPA: RNA methyltransferase [Clostridiales bacterium]|nr:RNA methyltransferase [Clostridiales bacterium]HQP70772.1 RNA methyltransferase [Clostridiales bacterium]